MNTINLFIIAAYLAALLCYRDKYFVLCCAMTLLMLLTPERVFDTNLGVIHAQVTYAIIYTFIAVVLVFGNKFIPAGAMVCMLIYLFIFSLDTWVNSNAETWIYLNHENIVIFLHSIVLLSFSKRLSSVVANCLGNISNFYNDYIDNKINPTSSSRAPRKKALK